MINDPYIEIINKTRSLNLDETFVEQSIDRYLKDGADKTLLFLIHDKKTPEKTAWQLMEEIKKEFRSSYYANALYAGVFMVLFLVLIIVFLVESDFTNIWLYPGMVIFLGCTYFTLKNLIKGLSIK